MHTNWKILNELWLLKGKTEYYGLPLQDVLNATEGWILLGRGNLQIRRILIKVTGMKRRLAPRLWSGSLHKPECVGVVYITRDVVEEGRRGAVSRTGGWRGGGVFLSQAAHALWVDKCQSDSLQWSRRGLLSFPERTIFTLFVFLSEILYENIVWF